VTWKEVRKWESCLRILVLKIHQSFKDLKKFEVVTLGYIYIRVHVIIVDILLVIYCASNNTWKDKYLLLYFMEYTLNRGKSETGSKP